MIKSSGSVPDKRSTIKILKYIAAERRTIMDQTKNTENGFNTVEEALEDLRQGN